MRGGKLYALTPDARRGPRLPWDIGALAEVLKGVFGLADAPREWFLQMSRCLKEKGGMPMELDAATWTLTLKWRLAGAIPGYVGDLVFSGGEAARRRLPACSESIV